MPIVGGPEDVFAARAPRGRRPAAALVPILGAALGCAGALLVLHLAAARLPAWSWLAPSVLLAAAGAGALLLWRLDRRRSG
ncbi:MAG: hypothetical protein ACOVK7_11920 [Burkholderiaceae bacterium]|jgi:hypothetical protein|nr:hypothetical protein [Burkholderiales bacterium]